MRPPTTADAATARAPAPLRRTDTPGRAVSVRLAFAALCATAGVACAPGVVPSTPPPDARRADAVAPTSDARADAADPRADAPAPAAGDDAEIVAARWPDTLACGATASGSVTVRNTGTATWTRAGGYKLGAVGDADPLHPGDPRVWLSDVDVVPPGGTHTFEVALTGPMAARAYTTQWRMVHEAVAWFGGSTSHNVTVDCSAPPPPDAGAPDVATPPPTIDLSSATILNSPNVATWAETARITRIEFYSDGLRIDFTKRDGPDSWPDVPDPTRWAPGDSVEYTIWMIVFIDGHWVTAGGIECWRGWSGGGGPPSQFAMNWYYDPGRWGPLPTHQPAPGDWVGFVVTAGDARNNGLSIVQERTNVVVVRFPADTGATYTF